MIRPFEESDRNKILALCEAFWSASCEAEMGAFDLKHTSEKLDLYLSCGACLVTGEADGFILICESTSLCNANPIAAEVAWYVSPDSRGGAGIELLKAAFRYCELKGIHTLSMIYMQSSMPEAIVKIYDRMGLTLRESTYTKRFN